MEKTYNYALWSQDPQWYGWIEVNLEFSNDKLFGYLIASISRAEVYMLTTA